MGVTKKRWEKPRIACADVREVTRGGIQMMGTDPLDPMSMMS